MVKVSILKACVKFEILMNDRHQNAKSSRTIVHKEFDEIKVRASRDSRQFYRACVLYEGKIFTSRIYSCLPPHTYIHTHSILHTHGKRKKKARARAENWFRLSREAETRSSSVIERQWRGFARPRDCERQRKRLSVCVCVRERSRGR